MVYKVDARVASKKTSRRKAQWLDGMKDDANFWPAVMRAPEGAQEGEEEGAAAGPSREAVGPRAVPETAGPPPGIP